MTLLPRRVRVPNQSQDSAREHTESHEQALSDFRQTPAWVLLGEPGAGKTEALRMEAKATGGLYLTAGELIHAHPLPAEWQGRTLFIDAMDETRAASAEPLTQRLANQLRNLGRPAFRLSCRAADWHGETDRTELCRLSPDENLPVLQLCPFSNAEIRQLLQDNHGIADACTFVEQAERHRIAPLLSNPQTLKLMAKAISDNRWPDSRTEVYRLACEKLTQESNRKHRDARRSDPVDTAAALLAAGQLFAVQLLAGLSGIALDADARTTEYPEWGQLELGSPAAMHRALQSSLFSPTAGHDERLIPCHRSVAEYLAARWLAELLDQHRLPFGRLLKLLTGYDCGVVADLRGLFAWLAQFSIAAKTRLIEIDPLGIVLYGDVQPLSTEDKRRLLHALRQQAKRFAGFRWHLGRDLSGFAALADAALVEEFRQALQAPERDEATQSYMDCVLDILQYGSTLPALADQLLATLKDASLWPRLRHGALRAWLKQTTPQAAKALLPLIRSGLVEDEDDELLARLLDHLYPDHVAPDELLQYLHPPKSPRLIGSYLMFRDHGLPLRAPDHQLPALLSGISERHELFDEENNGDSFSRSAGQLLVRALEIFGETASDAQLFAWLGVGANEYGRIIRDPKPQTRIQHWLADRPERYKDVLDRCIRVAAQGHPYFPYERLHYASPPGDLGLWHLQRAGQEDDEAISRLHLSSAIQALELQRGAQGLSLETLAEWERAHPERACWLDEQLVCSVEDWRRQDAIRRSRYRSKQSAARRQRTQDITPHLSAISAGAASPYLLDQLAGVWLGHFSDIQGKTITERFADYCELGDELMQATESGFKRCLQHSDLPAVEEIIQLSLERRRLHIGMPSLLGLQLLCSDDPVTVAKLPGALVERLLAFAFCMPHIDLQLSDWLAQTAQQRPALFAEILVRHAAAAFDAGESSPGQIHLLDGHDAYGKVASLAIPELLRRFPEQATEQQLRNLQQLLQAALVSAPDCLKELTQQKLLSQSLDNGQRVLWCAIATLAGHPPGEEAFWRHIDEASNPPLLVAELMRRGLDNQALATPDPERLLRRLIEQLLIHAELGRATGGFVTTDMQLGDQVRGMLNSLGSTATQAASDELQQLLDNPDVDKLRYEIQHTLEQQRVKRREALFRFSEPAEVVRVLSNRSPAGAADLTALALDYLDDIAHQLRHANDDGYRAFWNVAKGTRPSQREENLCRDALLTRLRPLLSVHGIGIEPEADHARDKRADLQLDYRNQFALPIEIKRDSHSELWRALRGQLLAQYVNAPKVQGHGIYLVFWFGDPHKTMPATPDGSPKPVTPQELQSRLEAQLSPAERQRVFVRVVDVSWP